MKSKKSSKRKATLEDLVKAAREAGVNVTTSLDQFIGVGVTQQMEDDLAALVRTGLFGVNISEAARRILEMWLWENSIRVHNIRGAAPHG